LTSDPMWGSPPRGVIGAAAPAGLLRGAGPRNHVQFLVAVIPTKEMVFAEYLERAAGLPLGDIIQKLLRNEREAQEKTFRFFLPMRRSRTWTPCRHCEDPCRTSSMPRSATDMHPGRNGYRVIAEAIVGALKQNEGIQ
jgi:hypothetical protein